MMKDNTFNIYKDRLVEINKILTDGSLEIILKFAINMKKWLKTSFGIGVLMCSTLFITWLGIFFDNIIIIIIITK